MFAMAFGVAPIPKQESADKVEAAAGIVCVVPCADGICEFPAGVYTVCTGAGMLSGKCDGVLSDDSSGTDFVIDFHNWRFISGVDLVRVSAGCQKYIF